MDIVSKDFLSNLPDALVGHILSFLTTKEAALTSVLSKRWRCTLALVPNLDFDDEIHVDGMMFQQERLEKRTRFQLYVDRVMTLHGNASVNKFYLRCDPGSDPSSVNRWIFKALECSVVDFDVYISSKDKYLLPQRVFMCKTLVSLKVAGTGTYDFTIDVGEVFLPKLKNLHINGVAFIGAALDNLISGCHGLVELDVIDVFVAQSSKLMVCNSSLKRVTIVLEKRLPVIVSFDIPNLVHLEYTSTIVSKYPKVNFNSLVEAKLNLEMRHYLDGPVEDLSDFLMGICNVQILYLSASTLEVLAFRCKNIPVFNNLIHLTVETDEMVWESTDEVVPWESLLKLLENCPVLDTLVFEGLHYEDTSKPWEGTRTYLSSSPVKTLKVLKFGAYYCYPNHDIDTQKEVIKYLLETMPNLEQVMIYYDASIDDDPSLLSTELQRLDKIASSKCKIQVLSNNISFSCTVHS